MVNVVELLVHRLVCEQVLGHSCNKYLIKNK